MCKICFFVKWHSEKTIKLKKCLRSIVNDNFGTTLFVVYVVDVYKNNCDNEYEKDKADNDYISDRVSKLRELEDICDVHYRKSENGILSILEEAISKAMDYYIFLDELDTMSSGWNYAFLTHNSHSADDIVICHSLYRKANGELFKYNLSMAELSGEDVTKEAIINSFYLGGGEDRFLTELSNKFISKHLLEKFAKFLKHGVYGGMKFESLANNYVLINAGSLSYAKLCCVIIGIEKEIEVYSRSIEEIVREFSEEIDYNESTKTACLECIISDDWVFDWYRTLKQRLKMYHPDSVSEISSQIECQLGMELYDSATTGYLESLTTNLGYSYNYKKSIFEFISSDECEFVGFDIFDTLIQRPFFYPTDIFHLLNKKYNELVGKQTVIDFSNIRLEGERSCRAYYTTVTPNNEDVNIQQIYDFISSNYGISSVITNQLLQYEINLELEYCKSREIGKQLYELAKKSNKKIVVVSDMYLPESVIATILEKNEYKDYKKLYLSNTLGISKYSGRLFKYVLEDLRIHKPDKMCFIGDNYEVDFKKASEAGLRTFHIPKATDIFMGLNRAIYSGKYYKKIYEPNGGIIDQGTVLKYFGIRCMMAIVANKFFGDPFVSFNENSDFDADPRFIGYYCVGMFLYSEALWLLKETSRKKIDTIHFVARDGYFAKEAYDEIKKVIDGPASDYMYLSRKAIAPLYMSIPEGIYELFLKPHILNNTPHSVTKLLNKVVKDDAKVDEILLQERISPYKEFPNLNSYFKFSKVFVEKLYDKDKAQAYSDMMYEYFSQILKTNDIIFDVGYSGRMENALTKLLGYPVNSCYFHEHEPWALQRKETQGFSIDSFYSFKPCAAFVVREQIFTPNQASCNGFNRDSNGKIVPTFAEHKIKYKERYVMGILQQWSLLFVKDLVSIFGENLDQLVFNKFDACIPFEFYMHYAENFDKKLMAAVEFEDEFGTNDTISLYEYWRTEAETYHLNCIVDETIDYATIKEHLREEIYREEGVFKDGVFMKMYNKVNKLFPIGSKRREFIKKISGSERGK